MEEYPLLPCPFCGAKAVINHFKQRVAINCAGENCWAQQKGPKEMFSELAAAWNKRK